MDSAVIAAIISVLGAGFLAMLFFFMRGIRADLADVRAEIRALRGEMQAEFAAVRAEMRAEFAAVRGEMQAEFAAVRAEIQAVRTDVATLQQTVARHEGVLGQQGRPLGTATG
ncbi:hypothetical protein [Candidatus Poriferisodalis sp.]|uniref:hypothetical protein n=1 Tax=Candidatus Poriferisodalis sp. TaxID=3101277 RepID=UPI003B016FB0